MPHPHTSSCYIASPYGWLIAETTDLGVSSLKFADPNAVRYLSDSQLNATPSGAMIARLKKQLQEYFSAQRTTFEIPLDLKGTDFERAVWHATSRIPYGETRSYKQIAHEIRSPLAYRAVGTALSKNSVLLLIPCHRVICASGAVGNFSSLINCKSELIQRERGF